MLHQLTDSIQLQHFAGLWHVLNFGLSNVPNCFMAPKLFQFSITRYDNAVICYRADSSSDTDPAINSQLTKKSFL